MLTFCSSLVPWVSPTSGGRGSGENRIVQCSVKSGGRRSGRCIPGFMQKPVCHSFDRSNCGGKRRNTQRETERISFRLTSSKSQPYVRVSRTDRLPIKLPKLSQVVFTLLLSDSIILFSLHSHCECSSYALCRPPRYISKVSADT